MAMGELSWFAREKHRGDDITDVISGEFFPDEDRPALPLVREALQNAIDAGRALREPQHPVRVRIAMRTGQRAAPPKAISGWFQTLWPHLKARGNGLREVPCESDPCDYLVVEDFGTCGLTGDVSSDAVDGEQNNFVDFVRSDGRTRKSSSDQGSWGVGKNVFPRCSRINSYIAYTIRGDDRRGLLIGKCVLKIRSIESKQFQPQLYLCSRWEPNDVPMPCESEYVASLLRQHFEVTRRTEPGLSIVVPWIYRSLRAEEILEDVVSQYYFAILGGRLEVDVDLNGSVHSLTAESIIDTVARESILQPHLPHVRLAAWAMQVGDGSRLSAVRPPQVDGPQKWANDLLPDDVRRQIRERLEQRERVAIRVPLHVRRSRVIGGGGAEQSFFDVYLEHDNESRLDSKPRFFRESLRINEVKRAGGAPKVRSLVEVHDGPLADLLRAAEPPNHSDWVAGTANFKGAYVAGNHVVTFVKAAVRNIMAAVNATDEVPDSIVAIDYFSAPMPTDPRSRREGATSKRSGSEARTPAVPELPAKQVRFRVYDLPSGFRIVPGPEYSPTPGVIMIRMAYDVMAGSPWKQYEPADFDLRSSDRSGIEIETSGNAQFEIVGPNRIRMIASAKPFELKVFGFDPNRDLIVDARAMKESSSGDPQVESHEEN